MLGEMGHQGAALALGVGMQGVLCGSSAEFSKTSPVIFESHSSAWSQVGTPVCSVEYPPTSENDDGFLEASVRHLLGYFVKRGGHSPTAAHKMVLPSCGPDEYTEKRF